MANVLFGKTIVRFDHRGVENQTFFTNFPTCPITGKGRIHENR
ncbi:unnamed protein product, partial [Staurois parvus]